MGWGLNWLSREAMPHLYPGGHLQFRGGGTSGHCNTDRLATWPLCRGQLSHTSLLQRILARQVLALGIEEDFSAMFLSEQGDLLSYSKPDLWLL